MDGCTPCGFDRGYNGWQTLAMYHRWMVLYITHTRVSGWGQADHFCLGQDKDMKKPAAAMALRAACSGIQIQEYTHIRVPVVCRSYLHPSLV